MIGAGTVFGIGFGLIDPKALTGGRCWLAGLPPATEMIMLASSAHLLRSLPTAPRPPSSFLHYSRRQCA